MLAVGEDLGLVRKIGAAGIDEVDAGQPVLARDLLGAQMLLHRHRVIGAALDGGIVRHDHAFAALDARDASDQAGAVDIVVVHPVGGERGELEKRRARIDQRHHAVAGQQLAALQVTLARLLGSAGRRLRAAPLQFLDKPAQALGIGAEFSRGRIDAGCENRHGTPKTARRLPFASNKSNAAWSRVPGRVFAKLTNRRRAVAKLRSSERAFENSAAHGVRRLYAAAAPTDSQLPQRAGVDD